MAVTEEGKTEITMIKVMEEEEEERKKEERWKENAPRGGREEGHKV